MKEMKSEELVNFIVENFVKRAYFKMSEDGKSGMIICRKRCSTQKLYYKHEVMACLDFFRKEKDVSKEEYWELKGQIENSILQ